MPSSNKDILSRYVPQEAYKKAPVEVEEDLLPVVERIRQVLPQDKVWEWFSSTSGETGGKISFPYVRIDTKALACEMVIQTLTRYPPKSPEKLQEDYNRAALYALRTLIWVEIGFQGLENLARSPASKNWTPGGHFIGNRQRERDIMTTGRKMYMRCLRTFLNFRREHGITTDCFTEYHLEYLLDTIEE